MNVDQNFFCNMQKIFLMDSDTVTFIGIILVTLAIVAVIVYFIANKRSKKYIIYADNQLVRTYSQMVHEWKDLKRIQYINKYIAGRGAEEMNVAIDFHFMNGTASIDRKSNIYEQTFLFSKSLNVPKNSHVTKGLIVVKEK